MLFLGLRVSIREMTTHIMNIYVYIINMCTKQRLFKMSKLNLQRKQDNKK